MVLRTTHAWPVHECWKVSCRRTWCCGGVSSLFLMPQGLCWSWWWLGHAVLTGTCMTRGCSDSCCQMPVFTFCMGWCYAEWLLCDQSNWMLYILLFLSTEQSGYLTLRRGHFVHECRLVPCSAKHHLLLGWIRTTSGLGLDEQKGGAKTNARNLRKNHQWWDQNITN